MNKKTEKFLVIIDDHKGIIYKVVNAYCKNKDYHDDLVQEIILQLWKSFETYNHQYKLSTWIYRIALNTAISFYRKSKKTNENTLGTTSINEGVIASDETYIEDPKIVQLNTYISELKEIDKALILLHLEELSHKEIAKIIGISTTNVGTKLTRIKKILKNKFNLK